MKSRQSFRVQLLLVKVRVPIVGCVAEFAWRGNQIINVLTKFYTPYSADTVVIGGKLHKEVYEILTKDKTKYNCEHGGLTEDGTWKLGKELVKVETQKGIKS